MSNKVCLVLIGTAGTGKSTIAGILSGQSVKSSSSNLSCTKDSSVYDIDSNLCVIDTVGCEDSSGKPTSAILDELIQFLAPRNITKIKIIWTGIPSCRSTQPIQKQAIWIGKLGENIWKSTILISKMGNGNKTQDVGGRLGCTKSNFEPKYKPLHILDLCDTTNNMTYKIISSVDYSKRSDGGYIWKKELKKWLLDEMKNLETCEIKYECYHSGSRGYYHPGTKRYKHPGRYTYTVDQAVGGVVGSVFTLGLLNISKDFRKDVWHREWTCCPSNYQYERGCEFDDWSCCSGSEDSRGCRRSSWSCCGGSEYSSGCKWRVL